MNDPPSDPRLLIERWQSGSETAAQQLFDRYVERLLLLARWHISEKLRSRIDPEDVVQSVFRTFFVRVRNDHFSFDEADDLFKLLTRITLHKTLRQVAFHRAARRNPEREQSKGSQDQDGLLQILDTEPDPQTVVAFTDHLKNFLVKFPPQDQQVIELRLQGYSSEEIAERLGTYDRKVRRVLERIHAVALQEQSEREQHEQSEQNKTERATEND
jgi:RNA polymerase sigma factor (sigma-70 family)